MSYEKEYRNIFDTEQGRSAFEATRQAVKTFSGEFNYLQVEDAAVTIAGCVGNWDVLNTLDHLVTLGELMELTDRDKVRGQDRRYKAI